MGKANLLNSPFTNVILPRTNNAVVVARDRGEHCDVAKERQQMYLRNLHESTENLHEIWKKSHEIFKSHTKFKKNYTKHMQNSHTLEFLRKTTSDTSNFKP